MYRDVDCRLVEEKKYVMLDTCQSFDISFFLIQNLK